MKYDKKVICGVIAVLVVTAIFLTAFYQKHKLKKGTWEEEFYHCVTVMEERLIYRNTPDHVMSEYDERVTNDRIEQEMAGLQAGIDFMEAWVEQAGDTQEEREEIFKKATVWMAMIYDAPAVKYKFAYEHDILQEKILADSRRILERKTIIDTDIAQYHQEFDRDDNYGAVYQMEAKLWENEFLNCMKLIDALLSEQTENQSEYMESQKRMELWQNYIEKRVEHIEGYWWIDSGSGMNRYIAEETAEFYRTATMLMIDYYEQYAGTYEFIYDAEVARETLIDWIYP